MNSMCLSSGRGPHRQPNAVPAMREGTPSGAPSLLSLAARGLVVRQQLVGAVQDLLGRLRTVEVLRIGVVDRAVVLKGGESLVHRLAEGVVIRCDGVAEEDVGRD